MRREAGKNERELRRGVIIRVFFWSEKH